MQAVTEPACEVLIDCDERLIGRLAQKNPIIRHLEQKSVALIAASQLARVGWIFFNRANRASIGLSGRCRYLYLSFVHSDFIRPYGGGLYDASGSHVVFPVVPGASHDFPVEHTFAQGTSLMRAD